MVLLSWLGLVPHTKKLKVQFPIGLHAWRGVQSPVGAHARSNWSMFFSCINVSLPFFLPPFPSLWNQKKKKKFKDFIYFIFSEGEEKEKERERNISVWLPLARPLLGTWTTTQVCALTGNRTSDPLLLRPTLNPLSYTSQGEKKFFQLIIAHFCDSKCHMYTCDISHVHLIMISLSHLVD